MTIAGNPVAHPASRVVIWMAVLRASACGSPPAPDDDRSDVYYTLPPTLSIACVPAGSDVRCSATYHPHQQNRPVTEDVTQQAQWSLSDATVATMIQPGLIRPLAEGA